MQIVKKDEKNNYLIYCRNAGDAAVNNLFMINKKRMYVTYLSFH